MPTDPAAHRDILFARLDVLSWRLQHGEDNEPGRLLNAITEALALAPELSVDDRLLLMDRLGRAQTSIEAAQQRIAARMAALPAERRALRGYVSQHSARPITGRVSRRA
jgi:hypothetical protein